MSTIPREFWTFLNTVDLPVERDPDFLRVAAGAFLNNSTSDAVDLVGFEVSDAKKGEHTCVAHLMFLLRSTLCIQTGTIPDAGVAAFMRRAAAKANDKYYPTCIRPKIVL